MFFQNAAVNKLSTPGDCSLLERTSNLGNEKSQEQRKGEKERKRKKGETERKREKRGRQGERERENKETNIFYIPHCQSHCLDRQMRQSFEASTRSLIYNPLLKILEKKMILAHIVLFAF